MKRKLFLVCFLLLTVFVLANIYVASEKRLQNQEFYDAKMTSQTLLNRLLVRTKHLFETNEKSKKMFEKPIKDVETYGIFPEFEGKLYFLNSKDYKPNDHVIIIYNEAKKKSDGLSYVFGITIEGEIIDIKIDNAIIDELNKNYFSFDFKSLSFGEFKLR